MDGNVRFWVESGHSSGRFLTPNRLRPLFSKADVHMTYIRVKLGSAFGHNRPFDSWFLKAAGMEAQLETGPI